MALTDYDKKNLSASDQKKIQDATDKWNAANAKGDKAGMASAAAEAAAIRNNAGYKTDSSGNYAGSSGGSSGGGTSSNKSTYSPYAQSGYTIGSDYGKQQAQNMGIGQSWTASDGSVWTKQNDGTITVNYNGQTYNNAWSPSDLGIAGRQQVQAGVPYSYVQDTMNNRLNKALNTEGLEQYAYDDTYWMMYNYIQSKMQEETNANILAEYEKKLAELEQGRPDAYQSKYDPQIDALLNQILNREDFSYDVANDPLYQQYAQMYQREGDRAMKETLAEAAAGAGGMNSYAVTAAQQANSYYGSMLNDKIPELYQLAYNMYLNDKESMVQDLGILQSMDATQYARYRDTMNDFYNDKTFAYGAYNDAIQQGNWQNTYNYNSMWDKLTFNNNNYLTNREWNASEEQRELDNTRYDTEWAATEDQRDKDNSFRDKELASNNSYRNQQLAIQKEENEANNNYRNQVYAQDEVKYWINLGIMPNSELIAQAGMSEADVKLAVDMINGVGSSGSGSSGSGSSGSKSTGSKSTGSKSTSSKSTSSSGSGLPEPVATYEYDKDGYYVNTKTSEAPLTEADICKEIYEKDGKQAVLDYLKEALATGTIPMGTYMNLYGSYSGRK